MSVAELIEHLKTFDPMQPAVVVVSERDSGWRIWPGGTYKRHQLLEVRRAMHGYGTDRPAVELLIKTP